MFSTRRSFDAGGRCHNGAQHLTAAIMARSQYVAWWPLENILSSLSSDDDDPSPKGGGVDMFSGGDKGKIKLILLASAADVLWPPGGGHISDRSTGCGGKRDIVMVFMSLPSRGGEVKCRRNANLR